MKVLQSTLLLFVGVFALAACDTIFQNVPETLDQKAFALYGSFVAVEEVAANIVENPATPDGVVNAIAATDRVAKPLADTMVAAAREVSEVRAEIEVVEKAGGTPADVLLNKLALGLTTLQRTYTEARPGINALLTAVGTFQEDQ